MKIKDKEAIWPLKFSEVTTSIRRVLWAAQQIVKHEVYITCDFPFGDGRTQWHLEL